MNPKRRFLSCYSSAMALAAIAFCVVHGVELIIIGLINSRSMKIDPTGFITVGAVEALQFMVFFVSGWLLAYIPSNVVDILAQSKNGNRLFVHVSFGAFMGILFLPLCASVPLFLFHEQDDPTFFARCLEFGLPMMLAGALGGYVFWRCVRGAAGKGELAADQFS